MAGNTKFSFQPGTDGATVIMRIVTEGFLHAASLCTAAEKCFECWVLNGFYRTLNKSEKLVMRGLGTGFSCS